MDAVIFFKLISTIVIWMLAVVGGLVPMYIAHKHRMLTSCLNMLSAGIFLSGAVVHLLADAASNQALITLGCKEYDENHLCKESYPLANVFFGIGFLIILIVEVLAHAAQNDLNTSNDHEKIPLVLNTTRLSEEGHCCSHNHNDAEPIKAGVNDSCSRMTVTHAHIHGILGDLKPLSIIIFVALSFHSIMEGIGVGSQIKQNWGISLAIFGHKGLAAFALGLELINHRVSRGRYIIMVLLFSLMTPFGVMIGCIIIDSQHSPSSSAICTALAGGTFMYVAVAEIIPQELQDRHYKVLKCLSLFAGFSIFSLLAIWV